MLLPERSDGYPLKGIDPVRRFIPFLMPTRTESFVLCKQQVEAGPAREFLKNYRRGNDGGPQPTLFHLLLRAVALVMEERPGLNRFLAGGRLYQRRGVWISFSAKRSMEEGAPIFTRKRRFEAGESLRAMVEGVQEGLSHGRSGERSTSDKEVGFLLRLPPFALRLVMRGARLLNNLNLLPKSMIEADPMFSSVFIANLGSVGIDACYHHNYEYGTIPIFITMGRLHMVPVVTAGGVVEAREVFELKYTYDERVEDGFYCARALDRLKHLVEHPAELAVADT